MVHWDIGTDDSTDAINSSFLCGNPILIADGDITSKGDRAKNLEKMLRDRLVLLGWKEIENLLPESIVRSLARKAFDSAHIDVDEIRRDDYSRSEAGLGAYLDEILGDDKFGTSSGTVRNKVPWCEKAIGIMESTDCSLPQDVEELCHRILTEVWNLNFA